MLANAFGNPKTKDRKPTQKFVLRTAQLAARLSQLSTTSRQRENPCAQFHISPMHREIPPQPQAEDDVEEVALTADVDVQFADEWKARYASCCYKTYVDMSTLTPTVKQRHVLQVIHFRMI